MCGESLGRPRLRAMLKAMLTRWRKVPQSIATQGMSEHRLHGENALMCRDPNFRGKAPTDDTEMKTPLDNEGRFLTLQVWPQEFAFTVASKQNRTLHHSSVSLLRSS